MTEAAASPFVHYHIHIEPFLELSAGYAAVLWLEIAFNFAVLVQSAVLCFVLYRASTIGTSVKVSLINVTASIIGLAVDR